MEYLKAILPVAVAGIVIVALVTIIKKRSTPENKAETYMTEGLAIGLCLGAGIGASFHMNITYFICIGMLLGTIIGMQIKR